MAHIGSILQEGFCTSQSEIIIQTDHLCTVKPKFGFFLWKTWQWYRLSSDRSFWAPIGMIFLLSSHWTNLRSDSVKSKSTFLTAVLLKTGSFLHVLNLNFKIFLALARYPLQTIISFKSRAKKLNFFMISKHLRYIMRLFTVYILDSNMNMHSYKS